MLDSDLLTSPLEQVLLDWGHRGRPAVCTSGRERRGRRGLPEDGLVYSV